MKPKDIKDFNAIHYDTNTWGACEWIKVAKQYPSGSWTPWAWATVDKLYEFRRRYKSTLIFHTLNHYVEADTEKPQLCDLCFECDVQGKTDFELRQNFKRMQNTVDELYRFFADLGIEAGQIRFFFTGGRSVYVVVMRQVFGVEPMVELNQVMKHIAKYFNDGLLDWDEYLKLDENLYANPKMLRMPNSYYPKYDAWKIEISPQEFSLPEAELRKLAKEPRPPLYNLSEISTEPIPEAVEWYKERLREFQELQREREHVPVDPRALKDLSEIPTCIADLRANTIRENDKRNQATLLDATFCKSTGISKDDAFAIVNEWVQHIPDTLTDRKRGKERTIATKSVVESVYRGKQYKFACEYAQALDLECSQEACPLYNKKAFQKWNKRVKTIPNFTPTYKAVMISIDELRKALAEKVSYNGSDLLLHAPPGSGKTETTLRTVDTQERNILYSPPRREMLDYPMTLITHSACELIKPRNPIGEKPEHPDDMILWEATALCKHYKHAEKLAGKRWNVVKMLCSKKCDIGMAKCPYWKQFKVWGSALVTHHYLPIPYHMKSLIALNNPTIVFDEPTPTSLIEQVGITSKILTEEIARRKNPDIVKFLEVIRNVVEGHDGEYATGKGIIQKIILTYSGDFEKLLDAVIGWLSVPDDYVEIQVDNILTQSTEKAWLVLIDGKEHWIARSLCFESDISEKKLMIPYGLADQIGIDYNVASSETTEDVSDGEIPLNFLPDLATVLYDELQKYKQGKDYNSQLALTETSLKRKVLRMNLRKHLAISNCRLILLDAFGDAELLSKLTNRNLQAWTIPMAMDAEVIQIVDGYYGITTMWKKRANKEGGGIPKKTLEKRLIPAAKNIASQDPEGTVIITWKLIRQYIEKLQAEGKFDRRIVVDHFGNVRGSGEYEHKRQVIIIGAPSIQVEDLLQIANCIWHDDPEPLDDTMIKDGNWRPYRYREEETGNGYAVEVREFKDKRLNLLLKTYREYEIAQAAHRIRPLLYPGEKKIWLLTNLPIDELPPTKVTDLNEIIAETDPMFLAFKDEVARIQSQYSGVWFDCAKISFTRLVIEYISIYKACKTNFSHGLIQKWFTKIVQELGYIVTDVTIPSVPGRIKVYHNGNLDQDKIQQLYVEVKGIELSQKAEVTNEKTLLLKEKLKSLIKEAHKLCDALLKGDYSVIPSKYWQAETVSETVASVKFFLTNADKVILRKLGYTDEEIKAMKPDEGAAIIAANKTKAKT
jgi:hypothetical protein